MAKVIKIKKGFDINLKGKPQEILKEDLKSQLVKVFPDDFSGFIPKILVKVGDKVKAGTPVLYDKNTPELRIVAPVSGEVVAVNRGEKRKLISVDIQREGEGKDYEDFGKKELKGMSPETIKLTLADTGILAFLRQRPYDIIAKPQDTPRDIFVPGFYSSPLAPNFDFIVKGEEADFQTGLDALAAITTGKVYLGISSKTESPILKTAKNVEVVTFEGPHPAGNAGVQINNIKQVNKGEIVWTVDPASVLYIGRLFNKGIVDLSRKIALVGSQVKESDRAYYTCLPGTILNDLFKKTVIQDRPLRYISGDVLTGLQITEDGALHAGYNQITVIPEGSDTNEFVGWALPGLKKFSLSKTYPTFLIEALTKKEYDIDARLKGGRRAMIMSNEWDKVFPMDILPEFLIRAIIAMDIDKMESLGIYEVAPEDFALCEFVDTSKMELQKIVRQGLDWLYKEMM